MQTIMNQTNETAKSTKPVVEMRELSVDEMDAVSGGGLIAAVTAAVTAVTKAVTAGGQIGGVGAIRSDGPQQGAPVPPGTIV